MFARRRLASRRWSLDAPDGRVLRRRLGLTAALRSSSTSRSRAASRFCACVLNARESITTTPSAVMREPAIVFRRARNSSSIERDRPASKRNCTAVATLLTFWPPGPDERTNRSSMSESSMAMVGVIWSMYRGFRGFRGFRVQGSGGSRGSGVHWVQRFR